MFELIINPITAVMVGSALSMLDSHLVDLQRADSIEVSDLDTPTGRFKRQSGFLNVTLNVS